ncbi:MAG: hypothetical protein LH610_03225 [Sphingomonas bacterium]|nr:hypothetical protein [Sphingomonas bacterium]
MFKAFTGINGLRKLDARALASGQGLAGERSVLAGEKVARFNLREPCRELLKVVLNFFKFGEVEFLQPSFLLDLGKESIATLFEFPVFARAIRAERLDGSFVVAAGGLSVENGGLSALSPHRFRKLEKQSNMPLLRRKRPSSVQQAGRTCRAKATPQRNSRTRGCSGELRQ